MFGYAIWLLLLVPGVLTVLAWRAGLLAIATADNSKAAVRARIWPAMFFLAGPVAAVLAFVWLRLGPVDTATRATGFAWLLFAGAISSVAALVTSIWSPGSFRPLALFAAVAWTACFGLALIAVSALVGLR
jgi:hypothetical protein